MPTYGADQEPSDYTIVLIDEDWDIWLPDNDSDDTTWTMLGQDGDTVLSSLSREQIKEKYGQALEFTRTSQPRPASESSEA